MNWLLIGGGILLISSGAIWLIMNYREARALPAKQQASVSISGAVWILIGLGILLVGRTDGEGETATIGVALIVVGVVFRVVAGVALRTIH
jgi:hypothetical protein